VLPALKGTPEASVTVPEPVWISVIFITETPFYLRTDVIKCQIDGFDPVCIGRAHHMSNQSRQREKFAVTVLFCKDASVICRGLTVPVSAPLNSENTCPLQPSP
jgi:hypothetical protein